MAASPRSWPAGTAFVYAIDRTRVLSMPHDGKPGKDVPSTIAGKLAVAVVAAGPDAVRLRLELRAPRHQDAKGFELDDAEITRAFYVDARPDGRFEAFAFHRSVGAKARAELKGIAGALQIVDAPASTTWHTTELDGTGEYLASYQRDGRAIHKSKDRYARTLGSHGLRAPQDPSALTVKSSADIALAPTGWPQTVAADETLVVATAGFRLSYWTRTKAALVGVEEVSDLDALVASEKGGLVPDAPDVQGFADARRNADENRVAGASFDSLAKDLRGDDVHARNHAQGRMAALFRVQPGEALAAADTVLHDDLPDEARARILGALSSAGTPESQGALSSVIRASDAPSATRAAAAASLGLADAPTEDSEDALVSAMASPDGDVASSAALGAGNLVQRMNAAGSGDSSSAVDALLAALAGRHHGRPAPRRPAGPRQHRRRARAPRRRAVPRLPRHAGPIGRRLRAPLHDRRQRRRRPRHRDVGPGRHRPPRRRRHAALPGHHADPRGRHPRAPDRRRRRRPPLARLGHGAAPRAGAGPRERPPVVRRPRSRPPGAQGGPDRARLALRSRSSRACA